MEDSDEIETAVEIDEDFKFQPSTPEELAAVADQNDDLAVDVIEVHFFTFSLTPVGGITLLTETHVINMSSPEGKLPLTFSK